MKKPERSENDLNGLQNPNYPENPDKFTNTHFPIRALILVFAASLLSCASVRPEAASQKNSDIEQAGRPIRFSPRTDPFCWNRVEDGFNIVKRCLARLHPDLFNSKSRMEN